MKNKIVLIHPKNEAKDFIYPLGCLYLSAFLLRAGYEPVVFDHNHDDDYESFIHVHAKDALFIGVSAITGNQVKHGLAADPVSVMPEDQASQRPRYESQCVGRERKQSTHHRIEGGKKQLVENQRRRRSVQKEVIPFDGGAD